MYTLVSLRIGIVRSEGRFMLNHLTLAPARNQNFSYFSFLPALDIVSPFSFSHSGRYVMVSNCGFHLHLLDD